MNSRMMSRLGQSNPVDFTRGVKLVPRLSKLLAKGLTHLDGAIIYSGTRSIAENVKPENFPDLTGFECFVNHIHIEDQLDDLVADETTLLKQGIAFALATENQLVSKFPDKPYRIIAAATAHSCGVRFHLVRPREAWLASDLDGYGEEAVLVLEHHSLSAVA